MPSTPRPTPLVPDAVAAAVETVLADWEVRGEFSDQTRLRTGETLSRFANRLTRQGVGDLRAITPVLCIGFIDATTRTGHPPELATRHARRVALRMFFRTLRELGVAVGDPTVDIELPPRTSRTARPLADDEVALCRVASRLGEAGSSSLQRAVCWALAESTAVTSEISAVRLNDLDDLGTPRWVHLPGTRRHDARLGELTEWGSVIVARQVALLRERRLPTSTLLTYKGKGTPGQHTAQAAVCNAIGAVLASAGLAVEHDVRPGSVRAWAGRHLYDGGMPLEQVARRMGARSLDIAAEDIGLDWNAS